jgi:hypothetical protein
MFELEIWNYRSLDRRPADLVGFGVEALDGSIGKVDDASYDTDRSLIVVDTGPWIFGKKVMLPAGVIDRIDYDDEKVFVHRTKDEIKHAPEYEDSLADDVGYRRRLGSYYGPDGPGHRELDAARKRHLLRH